MDDTTTYALELQGETYHFKPMDAELLKRLGMILHMRASGEVQAEAAFGVLANAAGQSQWDAILRRYTAGDVTEAEVVGLLEILAKAQFSTADAE